VEIGTGIKYNSCPFCQSFKTTDWKMREIPDIMQLSLTLASRLILSKFLSKRLGSDSSVSFGFGAFSTSLSEEEEAQLIDKAFFVHKVRKTIEISLSVFLLMNLSIFASVGETQVRLSSRI